MTFQTRDELNQIVDAAETTHRKATDLLVAAWDNGAGDDERERCRLLVADAAEVLDDARQTRTDLIMASPEMVAHVAKRKAAQANRPRIVTPQIR